MLSYVHANKVKSIREKCLSGQQVQRTLSPSSRNYGGELQSYHNHANRELLWMKAAPTSIQGGGKPREWGKHWMGIPQHNKPSRKRHQSLPSIIKLSTHEEVGSCLIATSFDFSPIFFKAKCTQFCSVTIHLDDYRGRHTVTDKLKYSLCLTDLVPQGMCHWWLSWFAFELLLLGCVEIHNYSLPWTLYRNKRALCTDPLFLPAS